MNYIGISITYPTLNGFQNGIIASETKEGRYIIDIGNGKSVSYSKYNTEILTERNKERIILNSEDSQ